MVQLMNEDTKEKNTMNLDMVTINQESIIAVLYYQSPLSVQPCYESTKFDKTYVFKIYC